ncbi:hypothetical protein D918_00696 [Trichuris suis]|nr:hypothetical protein D918_00696 [Trichuris suis]
MAMLLILFALTQITEGLVIPEDGYSYPVEARTMFELKRLQKIDEKDPRVQAIKQRIAELKQTIERCMQKECKEHNVQQNEVEEIMKYANCAEKCYKKEVNYSTNKITDHA